MTGSDVTQIERDRRAAYATKIESETGINDTIVERLIHRFYRRVREDKLLGPVFAARITDWDPHLARMCAFWSSVVLMTGRYHGQPMQVHLSLPIDATHFDRWLELFEEAAREICSPIAAAHFVERAHRIAQSLQLGIAVAKGAIPPRRGIPPGSP